MMPRKLGKPGTVWYANGFMPRDIVGYMPFADQRVHVFYSTGGGDRRNCLVSTFRRWVEARGARRLQRHRRRELKLR